ncbi:MAG: alpha/beta fold hydrolase, partial [Chromatiales bacterium]|nr:alpha/beta fold hydrolase [Chromatiales bacterium]
AHRHPVINYDQRGIGQSPSGNVRSPVPMSARASEVFELLDALGLSKAHLVCHSTGCGIGLSMVAARPDRVATITLVSPWAYGDTYLTRMQNLRVAVARALGPGDYFRFNVSLLYPPDYRRQHEEGFAQMESAAEGTPVNADSIRNGLIPILAFDSRPVTAQIKCPALVVVGADDQLMPPWFGRSMAKDIPNSQLLEFDNAGHMILETRAQDLAARVLEFLSDEH